MPIRKYRTIQTGPKIQAGGLRTGLLSVLYQVGIEEIVKNDPAIPANSETAIAVINLIIFFASMGQLYTLLRQTKSSKVNSPLKIS